MAFAGAAAVAVIASIAIIRETPHQEPPRAYSVSYTPTLPYSQVPVTIQNVQNMQPVSLRVEIPNSIQPQGGHTLFPPSYLLQARPANHESPLSF